ncbi:MAG TPA: MDR family oxidoreductase [Thermoanaerobaculia bacterium]|nr:MDR family oxidoreductase [Thermoanaerobaculia bacterium]
MSIRAVVAREQNKVAIETLDELPPDGEVLIEVAYSSLNYKDALAVTGRGRIVRRFPMVLGIDLAGTVVESSSADFKPGDRVAGHGQGLGELDGGGYAQRQRVRADAIVPVPDAFTFEQAMQIGTAGFTAMLCVMALEQNDVKPTAREGDSSNAREVIVTGAAGGVGSLAVLLLAARGHRVAASTGRPELEPYLRDLGATSIVPRDELAKPGPPMQSERWAGGVDTVGGVTLANVFAQTWYEGAVACCGMAGGHELSTTVWPLILRNVSLLGVSSIRTPKPKRIEAWSQLARTIDPAKLASLSRTEPMSRIFELSEEILAGRVRGRVVIDVN